MEHAIRQAWGHHAGQPGWKYLTNTGWTKSLWRCYGKSLLGSSALRSHGLLHSRTSWCFPKPSGSCVLLSHGASTRVSVPRSWRETAECPSLGWPRSWGWRAASCQAAGAKHLCPFQPLGIIPSQLHVLLVAAKHPFWLLTASIRALWWLAPRMVGPKGQRACCVQTHPSPLTLTFKNSYAYWLFPRGLSPDYLKHPVGAKTPSQTETPQVPSGTHRYRGTTTFHPKCGSCCSFSQALNTFQKILSSIPFIQFPSKWAVTYSSEARTWLPSQEKKKFPVPWSFSS